MGAVLLATDFTARADRAEARAIERANALQAKLCVLTVADARTGSSPQPVSIERALRASHKDLVDLQVLVDHGEPWRSVVDHADSLTAELIVIGPGGPVDLKARLLGSTAERIIHRAAAPVLIVRRRVSGPYEKVVAATDFSPSSRHALLAAARVFPEAEIAALHAYRVPFEGFVSREGAEREIRLQAQADMEAFIAALEGEVSRRPGQELDYGTPDEVLPQYVREYGIDLVVLGAHGASGAFEKLLGGVTERLLPNLDCDVLVVREPPVAK